MKFVPVMVTAVPTGPLVGVNDVIVGGPVTVPVTVKALLLTPVPAAVVTLIGPVLAPLGTVALICVSESTVKVAATLLKVTSVVPVEWLPVMVTLVPTGPLLGVNEVIIGGADGVNTKSST